jgi:hypothetical protein
MAEIVSTRNTRPRGRKTRKHIASPGTLEEISRAVGVTAKDRRLVHKVLTELGYIGKASPPDPITMR